MSNIGFIGAGNMAGSIIGGLIHRGVDKNNLFASDLNAQALSKLEQECGIHTNQLNSHIAEQAETLILAVKPQVMKSVCEELKNHIRPNTLVISIAAGITCQQLHDWLGHHAIIVRCMPNTPALIQQGASGLYADSSVQAQHKQRCEDILSAVGTVCWVESEALIDAVTAVSGSGPAYFFYFLEGMIEAGVAQGLDEQTARTLAVQTAKGAACLAQQSDEPLGDLRRKVTSPGGTTEQAILSYEQSRLKEIIHNAMNDCAERSRELAKEG